MTHPTEPRPFRTRRRETILVVDDTDARDPLCEDLRRAGYEAVPLSNGVEALWYADAHPTRVDLILLHLMPPESDALHFGPVFGRLHAQAPVLFMSPEPHAETIRRGLLDPRAPYVQRPCAPRVLARRVRQTLDGWKRRPPVA